MEKRHESKNLKNSIYDGAAYSAAVGAGENYVSPYAIFRGATDFNIGLLSSFPALFSALFQLSAPYALNRFKNRKGLVLLAVFLNALSWLFILSTVFISAEIALPMLLIFFTFYSATNAFAGTLWASWIADLVPKNIRGYFFGKRNAITQLVSLVSTLLAGIFLGMLQDGTTLVGFAILFFVSFIFRLICFVFLKKTDDPVPYSRMKTENPLNFLRTHNTNEAKHVIILSALFLFAVTIAGPFFVAYMLRDLGFNYYEYTLIIIASSVSKIISMPYWGSISSRFGNKVVLTLGTFFISFIPFLWLLSKSAYIIALIELFSGFVWAAFELAIFNYLIGSVKREEIPSYMGNYTFFTGIARFVGPNVGAFLAWSFTSTPFLGFFELSAVILISGITRLLVSFLILTSLKEGRFLLSPKAREIVLQIMLFYPIRGLLSGVFLGISTGNKMMQTLVASLKKKIYR